LPPTFFGWIPVLWKITEDEVLASAGLDAFVFLRFFKMAVKYLSFVFFFVLTVIFPVQKNFNESDDAGDDDSDGELRRSLSDFLQRNKSNSTTEPWMEFPTDYLWIYVVFAYVFSGALIYLIITETNYIVRIRQKYLSNQSSVTDRTIRLSGIPRHLRSEEKITETIEKLQIGKVERVTLCRNWGELDELIDARMTTLRKLEEAWTVYLGYRRNLRKLEPFRPPRSREGDSAAEPSEDDDEQANLLQQRHATEIDPSSPRRARPTTRLWSGFFKLQTRKVDAIDYYEEQLQNLDERIREAREKHYTPGALAFVTLDSIAACQMAIQAILDPVPMELRARPAPSPSDVVWKNTYLPRRQRMLRAWSVTAVVVILTIVWWVIFFPVAGLLNIRTIGKVFPQLEEFLCSHETTRSLVTTTLPTLILSLMLVLVPYFYDCKSVTLFPPSSL
jgi:calcium permeable stress-gated cation channel